MCDNFIDSIANFESFAVIHIIFVQLTILALQGFLFYWDCFK